MKVADFGLARSEAGRDGLDALDTGENGMTDYVATRWYRAPEILFGARSYGPEVDLWSLGCIFAEMLAGKPVFSGASTLNQIEQIVQFLGWPDEEAKANIDSQFTQVLLDSIDPALAPDPASTPEERWRERFPEAPDSAISMLCVLMVWNPRARMKAEAGMTHEYCGAFHIDDQAERADFKVTVPEGFADGVKLQNSTYREKLYELIRQWRLDKNPRTPLAPPPDSNRRSQTSSQHRE